MTINIQWSEWTPADGPNRTRCAVVRGWLILDEVVEGARELSIAENRGAGPKARRCGTVEQAVAWATEEDERAAKLRQGLGIALGQGALISHSCVGQARAIWNGVGWHCQCGSIVFPPADVIELRREEEGTR